MKRIIIACASLLVTFLVMAGSWYLSKLTPRSHNSAAPVSTGLSHNLSRKINSKGSEVKLFVKERNYNQSICFLVDMSLNSGSHRFFVFDLVKDSIIDAGLVTHGRCNKTWLNGRKYGNEIGCGCTSLGKYKIGNAYQGRFGLAYKLHGLDATNSNAYKRFVVLHAHECVPNQAVDPAPICQSDGCPTVSPDFLQKIAGLINQSKKPVLLWIFE
jgi:hypothetical protein